VSDVLDPAPLPEELDIPAEDWRQTPLSVRLAIRTLLKRLEAFEARLNQNSSNSSRPPSTDSPSKKRRRRMNAAERRKPGGTPGHLGHPQVLLEPTAAVSLFPEGCSCGHRQVVELTPYDTR
jgi:transposase